MISRGPKFVLNSCLLMAVEVMSTNCFAQPQGRQEQVESRQELAADVKKADSITSDQRMGASAWQAKDHQFSENKLGLSLLKNIALDQKAMWTSPMHLRLEYANWLAPLAGVTAASLASDTGLSRALTGSPSTVSRSTSFSNYGVAALGGVAGGMYL